jgi:putative ABC transport system substrate-binding protein
MRRREFVTGIGMFAAWPVLARAQQKPVPAVAFLSNGSLNSRADQVEAFKRGLTESGYRIGQNIAVEYYWAEDRDDALPVLADEAVRRKPAVIVASSGTSAVLAAKAATSTIPVVFCVGGDPIKNRLVASINRPGGNVTGISYITNALLPKRLGLLRELVPTIDVVGFLSNPINPNSAGDIRGVELAAREIGQNLRVFKASTLVEIERSFENLAGEKNAGVLVTTDTFFLSKRRELVASAARYNLPTSYDGREFPILGGLMSYGPDRADAFREAGIYVGKILRGVDAAELPVLQPTKLQLVINLNTAKELNLNVPPSLLAITDEMIE